MNNQRFFLPPLYFFDQIKFNHKKHVFIPKQRYYMTSHFEGIIFDLDGTLWNPTGIAANAYNKAIEITGTNTSKITAEILQQEFGKPLDKIAMELWPNLSEEKRSKLVSCVVEEEEKELRNSQINVIYPGVIETLKCLSSSYNFYIVSNCHLGYMEIALEKTKLLPYIKDYEYFGRTLKNKAENIKLIMERNNIKSAVYVGDTQGDADSCIAADVPFIWASYGFGEVSKYWAKIDQFSDLIKILKPSE